MSSQQRKNKLFVLLIFGMAIVPLLLALALKDTAPFIDRKTNKGQLISPAMPTERSDLLGIDKFSTDNMTELQGRWVLLNIVPGKDCNTVCLDAIHKTKQLRLMLNKDLTRTRRAVLFLTEISPEVVDQWLQDDKVLLKVKPSANLSSKIYTIRDGAIPDGLLLLMDPLGNLMMQYEPGFDPYKVKSDLMHLLRISQIG